jgi:glycosyltransferase involved in cell wall biosynthesis
VAYEALACGLPVIATRNTGTVVQDGLDGFIVPAGNPESIVQRLEQLSEDRSLLLQMSQNALRRSKQFDLQAYRNNLLGVLPSKQQAPLRGASQDGMSAR